VHGEIGALLRRHSDNLDDTSEAEIVVSELIGNAVRQTVGPAWVSLHWTGRRPDLTIYDLGPGFVFDPTPRHHGNACHTTMRQP
jgi:hypothetical protein